MLHILNLVGACAECCLEALNYFGFLQAVYNFFAASTHRWTILTSHLPSSTTVVKSLSITRWSARADATKAVSKGYRSIYAAFEELQHD